MLELGAVIVTVIVVCAFSSVCEAALYSVPESHVESLISHDSKSGRILRRMRERIDRPITALGSLTTIANTIGAAVAGALAIRVFGAEWLAAFSTGLTVAILFLSEVIPKTVGVVHSRAISVLIAVPLQMLIVVFSPVIWVCSLATRLIAGTGRQTEVTPEEIIVMARLGQKSGAIEQEEVDVIQNILSVREKTVREIMTPRSVLFALEVNAGLEETSKIERLYSHSRVPAYFNDLDNVIGVVYRRDILAAIADGKMEDPVRSYVKPVNFVSESLTLDRLLDRFLKRRQHLFVVLNERNELSGVVTLEDVLEEILGKEIVDEFDEAVDMQDLARQRRNQATN